MVSEYKSFAKPNSCILTQSNHCTGLYNSELRQLDSHNRHWIIPFLFHSLSNYLIPSEEHHMHIAHLYCTSRQYLSMLWLKLYMIELLTKLVSQEISMCTPHRTLVDKIYNCNIWVILFHNNWMITEPSYIILSDKKKTCRGDKYAYGHVLFCSTSHNDSWHQCEYRDIMNDKINIICITQEGEVI